MRKPDITQIPAGGRWLCPVTNQFEDYLEVKKSMANIKSAKKRILVNRTKAARNKSIKSSVKTAIKKVDAAIAAKDQQT